jgi:hypothetical protein
VAGVVRDFTHEGLGVETASALAAGGFCRMELSQAAISEGIRTDPWVRICWCEPIAGHRFKIGLEFAVANGDYAHVHHEEVSDQTDLYEALQLSAKADSDTIHRVYRLLAQRFHPDNRDTGDEEEFKRITRAYEILGDPARRASYDAQFSRARERQWKVFHTAKGARGLPSEKPKRFAILHALYLKRVMEPHSPTVGVLELEDLLAIPREHLEFPIWYLKERGFLLRGDSNRLQITAAGVDHAEALAEEDRLMPPGKRLLSAAPDQP